MLPALVSRGHPDLLYKILGTFFRRRETERFSFAKVAFEYITEHSTPKLALQAKDLTPDGWRRRRQFAALLGQCLAIGAGEQAMQLLGASSRELED